MTTLTPPNQNTHNLILTPDQTPIIPPFEDTELPPPPPTSTNLLLENDHELSTMMLQTILSHVLSAIGPEESFILSNILHLLRAHNLSKVQDLIMSTGIDLNAHYLGSTVLVQCIKEGYEAGIDLLLSFHIDINLPALVNTLLLSPLMIAISVNRLNIMNILIINGANVNYQEPEDGFTPLIIATVQKNIPAVQLLLANYANPLAKNAENATAYDLAMLLGDVQLMHMLKEAEQDYLQ